MATFNIEPLDNSNILENVLSSKTTLDFDTVDRDFELVCLDVEITNFDDCHYVQSIIRDLSNHCHSFTDVDQCLEYLTVNWFYRIFFIVSDRFASSILSQVESIDQIVSIFIFGKNIVSKDLKSMSSEKYRGIFSEKSNLVINVAEDIFRKNSIYSIKDVFQGVNINEQTLIDSKSWRAYSILADVNKAARLDYEDYSISSEQQQMLRECRLFYRNDKNMMKQIETFSKEYNSTESIKWYTKDSFLFKISNKALRTQSSEIIKKFRFFIKNLEESLDLLFAKQTFDEWSSSSSTSEKLRTVYRGQHLIHDDIRQLQLLYGQNIVTSQYVSTTKDILVAKAFAGEGEYSPRLESVIFHIDTSVIYEDYNDKPDPSIYYYDIRSTSDFSDEEEVLFRIGTTFKVGSVEKLPDNRWHVMLRLEKVDDYRSKNQINRTPIDVVQSFFNNASQKQNISIENITNEYLSADTVRIMSVFIRLGHLVKHHPREQLQYYQSALSLIPSHESTLLKVGYWAIKMKCFSNVNDWTSIPLNIYRQTVLHIKGDLQRKLHNELARIDEARGDIRSATIHYDEVLKSLDDRSEKQLIQNDIDRMDNKIDELRPIPPPGELAYWCLYVGVLTTTERSLIDNECKIFHQSTEKNNRLSQDFCFNDLLPGIDNNKHIQLLNDSSAKATFDSNHFSAKHIFIKSLTDKLLTLTLENNLTVKQLKEAIRCNFYIPYPEQYDFRLIHMGISLSDENKSLDDYYINDQSVIYLVHGPLTENEPINFLAQQLQEKTGLTVSNMQSIIAAETFKVQRAMAKLEKQTEIFMNLHQNIRRNGETTTETVSSAFEEFYQENLRLSQYGDDDDDEGHLSDMPDTITSQYRENSGPQISIFQMMDLLSRSYYESSIEENNNNRQTPPNNLQHHEQNDNANANDQTEQQITDSASIDPTSLFPSDCKPS